MRKEDAIALDQSQGWRPELHAGRGFFQGNGRVPIAEGRLEPPPPRDPELGKDTVGMKRVESQLLASCLSSLLPMLSLHLCPWPVSLLLPHPHTPLSATIGGPAKLTWQASLPATPPAHSMLSVILPGKTDWQAVSDTVERLRHCSRSGNGPGVGMSAVGTPGAAAHSGAAPPPRPGALSPHLKPLGFSGP